MRNFLLIILILSMATMSFGKLLLEYEWKYLDLLWESLQQKEEAIKSGRYNASAAFFYDVDKALDGRVFITAVRDKGIPVSVLTVTEIQGKGGPLLRPYPDWSWYKDDCKGITGGVYNMEIKCNHLFVVDDGRIGYNQICLPQLLIFDLSTDKLVKRVTIPIEIAHDKTGYGLISSVAVFAPYCRNVKDAIVLTADVESAGLVVYNGRTSKMCRFESDFMKTPAYPYFVVANQSYYLQDTIYGLAIIGRDLYYAALAGPEMYKVELSKLIDCLEKDISQANKQTQMIALEGRTAALASDRCALFFSDITKTSLMCMNVAKEFNFKNKELVAYDPKQLQFPSGLKIRHGELLVLSNRYHLHISDRLNINEVNFRFLSMPVTEIEENTNCFSSCKY